MACAIMYVSSAAMNTPTKITSGSGEDGPVSVRGSRPSYGVDGDPMRPTVCKGAATLLWGRDQLMAIEVDQRRWVPELDDGVRHNAGQQRRDRQPSEKGTS